jgi:[ribosomal protein S5]-alanine N-acetyltransferase
MIRILTERLLIRDHKPEDLNGYHCLISDRMTMFFLPDLLSDSLSCSEKSLSDAVYEASLGKSRSKFFFGIFLKTGEYVGEVGYTAFSRDREGRMSVHLGYFILREYWGRGIMTEAVQAVVDYAFDHGDVVKIETGCLMDNRGSERVMVKSGFTREAIKKRHQFLGEKWMDRVEYGIVKEMN